MRANCQNVQRRACVGRDTGVAGTYAIHSVTIRHFSSESKLTTQHKRRVVSAPATPSTWSGVAFAVRFQRYAIRELGTRWAVAYASATNASSAAQPPPPVRLERPS